MGSTIANYSILGVLPSRSMASSITGPTIDLNLHLLGSISVFWTGTPVGTFKIQTSDEVAENASSVSNASFIDVPGSSYSVTAAGSEQWTFASTYTARYARIVYTATSSTGTITACNVTLRSL